MPLSSKGIVRGGDHDAEIGAQRARQHGDGRGRQRPDQHHIHAHRDETRGQRGLDHIARKPRILADDDAVAVLAAGEQQPGRLASLSAVSAVIGSVLAVPRMPSVPNSRRLPCYPSSLSFNLRQTRNARAVPATSCTRNICAPCPTA